MPGGSDHCYHFRERARGVGPHQTPHRVTDQRLIVWSLAGYVCYVTLAVTTLHNTQETNIYQLKQNINNTTLSTLSGSALVTNKKHVFNISLYQNRLHTFHHVFNKVIFLQFLLICLLWFLFLDFFFQLNFY